jgi:hypothetical protein
VRRMNNEPNDVTHAMEDGELRVTVVWRCCGHCNTFTVPSTYDASIIVEAFRDAPCKHCLRDDWEAIIPAHVRHYVDACNVIRKESDGAWNCRTKAASPDGRHHGSDYWIGVARRHDRIATAWRQSKARLEAEHPDLLGAVQFGRRANATSD